MGLEKLKLYLDFAKFFLGTFLIALITFIVKSGFESREIAIEESEQIGKYVEIALREDIGVRKRFAEYFKTVTISDNYRNRWATYYGLVKEEFDSIKREATMLQKEIDSLKKLNNNLQNDKDSISEVYLNEIDILYTHKAKLESELEVKSETTIPESYQIVLNSLNPIPKTKMSIKNYIENNNFKFLGDNDHEDVQEWLAKQSTVFYYSNRSRFVAKKIASDLRELTGVNFNAQLKTDLGVWKGQEDYSFIIHYIN